MDRAAPQLQRRRSSSSSSEDYQSPPSQRSRPSGTWVGPPTTACVRQYAFFGSEDEQEKRVSQLNSYLAVGLFPFRFPYDTSRFAGKSCSTQQMVPRRQERSILRISETTSSEWAPGCVGASTSSGLGIGRNSIKPQTSLLLAAPPARAAVSPKAANRVSGMLNWICYPVYPSSRQLVGRGEPASAAPSRTQRAAKN